MGPILIYFVIFNCRPTFFIAIVLKLAISHEALMFLFQYTLYEFLSMAIPDWNAHYLKRGTHCSPINSKIDSSRGSSVISCINCR